MVTTNMLVSISRATLLLLQLKIIVDLGTSKKWIPLGFEKCPTVPTGGPEESAYSFSDIGYITICPLSFGDFGPTIAPIRNADNLNSGNLIDDMERISTLLFHEFLHVLEDDTS
jgi:hypothetical protein